MPEVTLDDIKYSSQQNKVAGFYHQVYAVSVDDVHSFPTANSTDVALTDAEKSMTIAGNIVLKEGKKWAKFDVNTDSGELTYKRIKPKMNAYNTEYSCTTQYSDHNEGVLSVLDRFIFAFATIEGKMSVLGTPKAPCVLTEETGKNSTIGNQEKMITLKITAEPYRAKTYTGTIQLTAAPAPGA